MSKRQYRMVGFLLPLALVGFTVFASETFAQKSRARTTTTYDTAPAVQLTAAPTVVTACAGDSARVQLDARASSSGGGTLRYRWSLSGGRIDGDGPNPTWDLSGLRPGYYKAFVEVGASEDCVVFSSVTILVRCQPPPPQIICPSIIVSCPDKVRAGQSVTFSASVTGGSPGIAPVYNWTVSAGKIIAGEGTNTITVDTTGVMAQSVKATVTIPGYDALNCSASCVAQIQPEAPGCRKFDEFGNIARNDEKARLDNYTIEMQNDPTSTAYVIVYPGQRGRPGEVQQRTTRIVDYLVNSRGIDRGRVVTIIGPPRNQLFIELWICPQGAKAPAASARE